MRFSRFGVWSSASAIVACAVFTTSEARAQAGASTLTGRVSDASTKTPVGDVVVTVTSPALQGEETAVTDANGYFRVQNLPPGDYTIRLDKEQFKPYARSGINLRADVTIRVDSEILPESLKEEVVVVARNPTVDVGSSNTGLNVTNDFARRVPLVSPTSSTGGAVRSYEAVAQATPGTKADAYGTSINGTTSAENNFVVDGLSRNNAGFGTNGARLSMEFVKEVNVLTGGYMPEYGSAGGGILSAVTKSGSNEYHGGGWMYFSPGGLEGDRKLVFRQGQTVTTNPTLNLVGDVGAEIGGPIQKDKLWFYTGFIIAHSDFNLDRELTNSETGLINDQTSRYHATREEIQALAKLTYSADSRNRFTLTGYAMPTTSGGSNRFDIDPLFGTPAVGGTPVALGGNIIGNPGSLGNYVTTNTTSLQLDWDTETPSKKVLLKTTVGWMHQTEDTMANDGTGASDVTGLAGLPAVEYRRNTPGPHGLSDFQGVPPWDCEPAGSPNATQCPVNTYFTGGPGFLTDRTFDRVQARSVLTLLGELAGHHVFKVGIDTDFMRYITTTKYSGSNELRESTSGSSFSDFRNFSYLAGPDNRVLLDDLHHVSDSILLGGFVQDSWAVLDKVTVNAGVRYDYQLMWGDDAELTMVLPNMIAPRIGAVWDPTQKGLSKIYGNFSQYYQSAPLDIMDRAGSSQPQASASRHASGCDPRDPTQAKGICQNPATFTTLNGPESPDQKYTVIGAGKESIDPNLKPQYSNEIVAGVEYDLFKNARIGLNYTKRWIGRIIEDVSRDEAQTYFVTNPGEGATSDFPAVQRNYDAFTLFMQKNFGDGYELLFSYTLSWLYGNWAGLFRPETTQLDPFINSDFDLKSLTINRTGFLPGDERHAFKLLGSKTVDVNEHNGFWVGGAAYAHSGAPTSYLGSHPLYGADEEFILTRGAGNRLPWVYTLDGMFGWIFKLPEQREVRVSVDVYNLFNFQAITDRDQRYTSSDVNPIIGANNASQLSQLRTTSGDLLQKHEVNPNFSNPTAYQDPRQFRIGIRATF